MDNGEEKPILSPNIKVLVFRLVDELDTICSR